MSKKSLTLLLLMTAFMMLSSTITVHAGGKPVKTVESEKWEEDWVYDDHDWYTYEVSSTFWWRWTEWTYPDGTWKSKYEFKEWSRTTDAEGKPWSWNNNVVRIYNQKNEVYIVAEEWGDPWISHQIIKRVEVNGEVKIEFDWYPVHKPPI